MAKLLLMRANLKYLLITLKQSTMKKLLFSTVVLLGAMGICVTNFGNTGSKLPLSTKNYVIKDTVPTDTTQRDTTSVH